LPIAKGFISAQYLKVLVGGEESAASLHVERLTMPKSLHFVSACPERSVCRQAWSAA
jgi:hypothetical protein